MLRAEKIGKTYGGVTALDGVDFDVRAGAVNVLIGENGAGKSTLMKILAGVEQPTSGRLLLDGQPVRFASVREAAKAGVGIVFQELNLCPNLTVTQNIFLGREWHDQTGMSEETAKKIDSEIRRIVTDSYSRARDLVKTNITALHDVSKSLLEKETLSGDEILRMLRVAGNSGSPA